MTEKTTGKKPWSAFRKAVWGVGGVFLLLVVGFFLASVLVNSVRVPLEKRRAPAQIERLAGFSKEDAEKRTVPASPPRRDVAAIQHAAPDGPLPQASYEDYLHQRLTREPGLSSARIYLELLKQRESLIAGYRKQFYRSVGYGELPGPLTPAQTAWLCAQAGTLEKIHALGRAGALPVPGIEEMARQISMMQPTVSPDSMLLGVCQGMLGREAMLHLQEGDYVGSRCAIVDAWGICGLWTQVMYMPPYFWSYAGDPAQWTLREWAERGTAPANETKALLAELDRIEGEYMKGERLPQALAGQYLLRRSQLVWTIEIMPWNSPFFGWDIGGPYYSFTLPLSRTRNTSFEMPRLDRLAACAMSAMHAKRSAPQMLTDLDKLAAESFDAAKLPFPEFLKQMEAIEARPENRKIFDGENRYLQNYTNVFQNYFKIGFLEKDAWMHIIRAELGWRLNPQKTLEMRVHNFSGNPHNPWRDPFTERPLQVDSVTTPTLLWSLGPDLKDQQGLITYDPTNGTMSVGDIALRLAPAVE